MEPVPQAPVLAQWHQPGGAPSAEHMARVALRHARRIRLGTTNPKLALGLGVTLLVLVSALVSPAFLVFVLLFGALLAWGVVRGPHRLAATWRKQAAFLEPATVTLDAEGLHAISPSVADHLRWRVFAGAVVDEDVLVLTPQGTQMVRVFPLDALDPRVDRAWLASEIERLIAADASHAPTAA